MQGILHQSFCDVVMPHSPFVESGVGSDRKTGLREIASKIAAEFRDDPRIEGMAIVGSVARGSVDRVSDIDLMLYLRGEFSQEEIDRENRKAVDSGGNIYGGTPEEGFGLWRCVDGVKVDLGFNMIRKIDELIDEVLVNHSLENDYHLIADGILRSATLKDEGLIEGWKTRMSDFPDGLARKMVESNLRLPPFWISRDMCAGRNEPVWFPELLLDHVRRMLWVLCGLNRRFYPGKLKGFDYVAGTLAIAPKNFRERTASLFSERPESALDILRNLVQDLYDLVDRKMPEVDTAKAREWFAGEVVCRG